MKGGGKWKEGENPREMWGYWAKAILANAIAASASLPSSARTVRSTVPRVAHTFQTKRNETDLEKLKKTNRKNDETGH